MIAEFLNWLDKFVPVLQDINGLLIMGAILAVTVYYAYLKIKEERKH